MTGASASASMSRIGRRLRSLVSAWPAPLVADVRSYAYVRLGKRAPLARPSERDPPYWMLLPMWLLEAYGTPPGSCPASTRLLDDVLWGQYCLFLAVRLQDDLFDGQASHASLLYAADLLLIESVRTFSNQLRERSAFWRLFYEYLETTTRSIVEVDALQKAPWGMRRRSLERYAGVSAIFKLGSAALCTKLGRMKDFTRIARFADEIAMGGQILDDMEDIREDLARGRFNFATSRLLGRHHEGVRRLRDPLRIISHSILFEDGVGRLLAEVRRHLERARDSIAPLELAGPGEFLDSLSRTLDWYAAGLHRARARLLLGRLLGGRRRGRGVVRPRAHPRQATAIGTERVGAGRN